MQDYSNSIAIVGIGAIFPDTPDLAAYWHLIKNSRTATREVPPGRWQVPAEQVYDPEIGKPDHLYSTKGCFLAETPKLPELEGLDPLFHVLVTAGQSAFNDARTEQLDRSRIGVIVGNLVLPTETSSVLAQNLLGRSFEEELLGKTPPENRLESAFGTSPLNRYVAGLPASILARQLELGGLTNTVDAACASSLYAIKLAMDELLSGRCDAMLAGGVSRPDPLYTQMGFSQLRALSKRGVSAPFDADGDGLLTGEGAGLFLLKRVEDAVAQGDRIYGVIRTVGLSNDIDGSLLAPSSEGQLRAMRAAYQQAGWQPQDVDLIECHATGTPVGDAVEVASLKELWQGQQCNTKAVIGSVKSNIGHLLTAAGAAALTKVLLSMQAEMLPPTASFNRPQPTMELEQTPFKILKQAIPWPRRSETTPRRAAVSAFGFGGINAHLLVEEWLGSATETSSNTANYQDRVTAAKSTKSQIAIVGLDASFGPWQGLKAVQQRLLSDRDDLPPTPPQHWYAIQKRDWFRQAEFDRDSYKGWYMQQVQVTANRFRIPPKELEEMQPQQLLMLETAANALENAGSDLKQNQRTGCLIGIAFDLNSTGFSLRWPIQQKASGWSVRLDLQPDAEELAKWVSELRDSISPVLNANRTMGSLGNIVASRIAREFRIGGPSFTISSEDSSGLRALETAVRLLQQGELDQALVGAVDLAGDPRAVLARVASSDQPQYPIGEGACALVIKRLEDAERDGDRIYGLVNAVMSGNKAGQSRSEGLTNQLLQQTDLTQENIGLVTASGQLPESLEAISNKTASLCMPASRLGQSGAVSGMAAILQATLALYQEIIPADFDAEPPAYWLRNRADGPRRALVACSSVDGSQSQLLLEGWDGPQPAFADDERRFPLGPCNEQLFALMADNRDELLAELDLLQQRLRAAENNLAGLSAEYCRRIRPEDTRPCAIALIADTGQLLEELIEYGRQAIRHNSLPANLPIPLRERLFYTSTPLAKEGRIAFIFPGSGNHYTSMGRELLTLWPSILRQQDQENLYLKDQFQPDLFWHNSQPEQLDNNHQAVIFGQVATGCAISDLIRSFGVTPSGFLGYSLGESAALFASRTWHERDLMYQRMQASTLFTDDLAGECRAARVAWQLSDNQQVDWSLGVVMASADHVKQAIAGMKAELKADGSGQLFQFQIKDGFKAARRSATKAYRQYVEEPMTSQRRRRFDMELELRVYLLIINSPEESVIGGDSSQVEQLVKRLGAAFFPLHGVTTVHCEVARPVAKPYHDLHLFETNPPDGLLFYSGAKGGRFNPTRESCAAAILDQALHGIDYPATIQSAYADGIRIFLEMGPGNSCSRMINRILEGKPHLARAACFNGPDQPLHLLRMLASLVAERVPLDLTPLCMTAALVNGITSKKSYLNMKIGASSFKLPRQPQSRIMPDTPRTTITPQPEKVAELTTNRPEHSLFQFQIKDGFQAARKSATKAVTQYVEEPITSQQRRRFDMELELNELLQQFNHTQAATIAAHDAFLSLNENLMQAMAQVIRFHGSVAPEICSTNPSGCKASNSIGNITGSDTLANKVVWDNRQQSLSKVEGTAQQVAFERDMCMEFAIGKAANMLGPEFAEVDSFPTRVRLPDEPLMLVDRIVKLEGEPRSMTNGRVVTEHDIFPNAWYLDAGRIPTCIAVEAGQADLFLSGYLGIDFITRGLAVYRLLDAVVTFHRGLPGPGETINYDIKIERFFRQGDTWLLRFCFDATVAGEPLLTMRDGCAGFFSASELEAGRGIVRPLVDPRPTSGIIKPDWQELVPLQREAYTALQLDRLRQGDLAGCFGSLFDGLNISNPLTIPGDMMRLVHRVTDLIPNGGRYGLGMIRAEADIYPDDWFIVCHFVDDKVMPGTLMYECCMHTLRVLLLRIGWVTENDGNAVWEPVPGVASRLCCRGQVLETTKLVTYEVTIREIGYCPEPYVLVDALMYADGKPIVEISNMSCRLSGSNKEKLEKLWHNRTKHNIGQGQTSRHDKEHGYIKPAIYTKEQILAYSNGKPSEGFGDKYQIFDADRKIARLPGPPFQFMDRVVGVTGEPWQMKPGASTTAQFDLQPDHWFFEVERQPRMPFCILLEAALQPCGWLAAYVGSALQSATDISFRNLGGSAVQHRPIRPETGTLTCSARLTKAVTSGGMIIQEYDFRVEDQEGLLYEGETMFGFFSQEALANQVGIRDAEPYQPSPEEEARAISLPYPVEAPYPDKMLRMIDRIDCYIPDGGPAGLGYLRGIKMVEPAEWFFAAHFYEDPVTPGSLGLESFLQLLKYATIDRFGWQDGQEIACTALNHRHSWLYRGQVIPSNKQVTVTAWITAVDDQKKLLTASGFLSVDGKLIYQMDDFTVQVVEG